MLGDTGRRATGLLPLRSMIAMASPLISKLKAITKRHMYGVMYGQGFFRSMARSEDLSSTVVRPSSRYTWRGSVANVLDSCVTQAQNALFSSAGYLREDVIAES